MLNKDSIFRRTGLYGCLYFDANNFDDIDLIGENYLYYIIRKIKVWSGTKNGNTVIIGIQCFFMNIINRKILITGRNKGDHQEEKCNEFILDKKEYISDFSCKVDKEITNVSFVTNKGRKFKVGGEQGENKETLVTSHGPAIILSMFGSYRSELEAIGVVYMTRRDYSSALFVGYFELKYLLKKNEFFKLKTLQKANSFKYSDQVLLKVCMLPNSSFNQILRFCFVAI